MIKVVAIEEVPLQIFSAHFPYPLNSARLSEGCGLAFWYTDELQKVDMQQNEKAVLLELVEELRER